MQQVKSDLKGCMMYIYVTVLGIPNDKTVDGLLPKFPSWSLVCIGKYGSYTPSLGLKCSLFVADCEGK